MQRKLEDMIIGAIDNKNKKQLENKQKKSRAQNLKGKVHSIK